MRTARYWSISEADGWSYSRRLAALVGAAVCIMALAACGGSDSDAADAGDEAGPITVGVMYTAGSPQGDSLHEAAKLVVAEINDGGGIDGRDVSLKAYDDGADPSEGVRVMQRAVQQDGAQAILGVFSSDVAVALMPWAERLGVPLIVSGGTTTELPNLVKSDYDAYKNVFRAGITNSNLVPQAVADFSADALVGALGLKTAVLLTEEAAWAEPYLKEMEASFEAKSGLKVLDSISIPTDLTDFTAVYSQIKQLNADVIITGFAYTGLTPVVQWQQLKPTPYMAGVSTQGSGADFFEKSSGAAEGVMAWTQGADADITDKTRDFVKRFTEKTGTGPLFTAFATTDAFYVYKEAVERAGTTDTAKVVEELEQTDYVGTTGRIVLGDRDSDYPHDSMYGPDYITGVIVQWQDGVAETIWPADSATAEVR